MEFWIGEKASVSAFHQLSRRLESLDQSAGALGSAEMNKCVADSMNERARLLIVSETSHRSGEKNRRSIVDAVVSVSSTETDRWASANVQVITGCLAWLSFTSSYGVGFDASWET